MTETRTPPPEPAVVIDLDARRTTLAPARLIRLEARLAEDVGRSVRVQALERLSRR